MQNESDLLDTDLLPIRTAVESPLCVKLHQWLTPSSFALLHASVPQEFTIIFSSFPGRTKGCRRSAQWRGDSGVVSAMAIYHSSRTGGHPKPSLPSHTDDSILGLSWVEDNEAI